MIKALNPEAWCFITMFDNINPLSALIDPLAKRMQRAEERRINLIKDAKIIIVTKTVPIERIQPLINAHHIHFGENKFQEAKSKWLMTKKITQILNFIFLENYNLIKLTILMIFLILFIL
jgi:hypothetical protein